LIGLGSFCQKVRPRAERSIIKVEAETAPARFGGRLL
jgi:hypothetical protein